MPAAESGNELSAPIAQRVQEQIAASGPGDAIDLLALGRDLATAGQKALAHQLFVRATELAADNSSAWVWRAGSADSMDEAASCLNRALCLDPGNKKAEAGLHWILSEKIAPTQFASPQMARQAARYVSEGQRQMEAGNKTHAAALFARATALDHHNESAWLWRASATQDVDQALLFVEQALRLNPSNPDALAARKFLRERKLGLLPPPIVPAAEPIAPIHLPIVEPVWDTHLPPHLLAALSVLLLLLIYLLLNYFRLVP